MNILQWYRKKSSWLNNSFFNIMAWNLWFSNYKPPYKYVLISSKVVYQTTLEPWCYNTFKKKKFAQTKNKQKMFEYLRYTFKKKKRTELFGWNLKRWIIFKRLHIFAHKRRSYCLASSLHFIMFRKGFQRCLSIYSLKKKMKKKEKKKQKTHRSSIKLSLLYL